MPTLSLNASKKTKQTPAGEIPVDWGCVKLGDLLTSIESGFSVNADSQPTVGQEAGILKLNAVSKGRFYPNRNKRIPLGELSKATTNPRTGSVIITRSNTPELVGEVGLVTSSYDQLFLPDTMWQLVFEEQQITPLWINYILSSTPYRQKLQLLATGTSANMKKLQKGVIVKLPIPLPPLPEQGKIADILATWDRALETLDQLIAAKTRRKQALMQQLLTGKKRLPGFDRSEGKKKADRFGEYPSDWARITLGKITKEVGTRNGIAPHSPVLSSTKHHGLVLSEEYFGKKVYADDTSNYRVVKRGEFAYATNHIEEGSIGYQNICDTGLVSPIYTVFRTVETVDDNYLFRLLKSPLLIHFYQINTNASVDRRGSLRYKEFAKIAVWLPNKDEQTAIAQVLDTADHELRLLKQQRTALEQQKRGLMQQLLTGKVRVKP